MQSESTYLTNKRRIAFTLIELLVVIAIIAILAAILFPVFAKAREKARQTACLSNMKQIALSFMQYSSDYDETLPCHVNPLGPPYDNNNFPPGIGSWIDMVYPYIKSADVFNCPDAVYVKNQLQIWAPNAQFPRTCYSLNTYYFTANGSTSWQHGINFSFPQYGQPPVLSRFGDTAGTIDVVESFGGQNYIHSSATDTLCTETNSSTAPCAAIIYNYPPAANSPFFTTAQGNNIAARHNGGGNNAFLDGHVKWLPITKLLETSQATGLIKYFSIDDD